MTPREPIRLLSRDDLDDLGRTPRERYIAAVIRQAFRELDPDAPPEVVARVISDTINGLTKRPHGSTPNSSAG